MRLWLLLSVCLAYGSIAAMRNAPNSYVRFFNDSAKAVDFYVDSEFGCSVPANPEENNAYCDAQISTGKHTIAVKGAKLAGQSCEIFVRVRVPRPTCPKVKSSNCRF